MATIIQAPLYVPRPGDPTLWQGKPLPSLILTSSLSPGQIKPRWPWHFEQDDGSYWVGTPLNSNLLAQLLTSAGQVKPRIPWHFEQDDGSLWTGEPLPSELLSILLTSVGKVGPRWSWNFAEDHIPQWQFEGQTNRSLITSLVTTTPFVYVPWKFGFDDGSFWQGKPTTSALLADLLTSAGQAKPRIPWNFGLDESQGWYGQSLPLGERNLILLTTQVGVPFVNLPFAFGMDFSSYWTGEPTPSYTLYIPPPPPFSLGGDWLVLARRRFRR